jgi:endonuclease/exonuclease/phosphatase (EEP) superfamily protein YafD
MDATPPSLPRHAAARRPVGPIGRLLGLVAGGLFAATFAGWCGRWHWIAELAGHFSWYWFGIAMAGFAVAVVAGRRRTGIALAAAMVLNAWPLVPYWLPAAAPPLGTAARAAADADAAAPAGVSIVSLNLLASNRDTGRVVAYLRDRRADLVALLEVDDFWAEAIAGLADLYPHRFVVPRNDNFGIALLSRLPLDAVREAEFGAAGVPTIVADVPRPDGGFMFIATHPLSPVRAEWSRLRDAQLRDIAAFVAAAGRSCVVAGDFNATPWSPVCRDFAARSGLVDTALGRGLQTTWNARLWLPRIPIDHVYAPPRTMVVRRAVGPDVGSDHLPVEAEIILPRHDDMTGGIR